MTIGNFLSFPHSRYSLVPTQSVGTSYAPLPRLGSGFLRLSTAYIHVGVHGNDELQVNKYHSKR